MLPAAVSEGFDTADEVITTDLSRDTLIVGRSVTDAVEAAAEQTINHIATAQHGRGRDHHAASGPAHRRRRTPHRTVRAPCLAADLVGLLAVRRAVLFNLPRRDRR